jgi:hypothetical protein
MTGHADHGERPESRHDAIIAAHGAAGGRVLRRDA